MAVGRSLARAGREVAVLEAEPEVGMHSSSRNSEVIHAGLYYPEDSLKAQLCVAGKEMLYTYCDVHHVSCERIGKLVVASSVNEAKKLAVIKAQAERNGVSDLQFLAPADVQALEPAIECYSAVLSPSTGIVDSHALMLALQGEIEDNGGYVLTHSRVSKIRPASGGFEVSVAGENDRFACSTVVNAAGLRATDLAASIEDFPTHFVPKIHFAKGHYFSYTGKSPFKHLVYPVPIDGGLGIHATNDLGGAVRFGPDVTWVQEVDYGFDESRRDDFAESVRRYFPELDESALAAAYTGIRSKLAGPGDGFRDFLVQDEEQHSVPGLINLFGFDSPGLTSCLAIGDHVAAKLSVPTN